MTETLTTRFGFTHWGDSSTDGPSMTEFNNAFAAIESLAAKATQGTLAARPAAGQAQRFYYATDNDTVYYDNGSAWKVVGSITVDEVIRSSATGTVPFTVNVAAGQTADLARWQVNAVTKASIDKDGNLSAGNITSFNQVIGSSAGATRGLQITGHATQSADLFAARNNAGTDQFTIGAAGAIGGTFLAVQTDQALIGGTGFTTLANQTTYTGSAALEVRSTKGGTGAYDDALVVRHPAFTSSAVRRRLGLLLKIGDEVSGDVAKAGGLYIESSAANAALPKLVLQRGDAPAMTFAPFQQAQIHSAGLVVEGPTDLNITGTQSIRMNTNAELGAQGSSMYARVPSAQSFYWYGGGVHSDTPGAAGAGGATAAQLTGAGLFTVPRLLATSTAAASLAQASPALMVGAQGSANLIADTAGIQARNNGVAAALGLNTAGGNVNLGSSGYNVVVHSSAVFKVNGRTFTIADSAPGGPAVGDVWIDT